MLVAVVLLTTSLQGMEKGVSMDGQRFLTVCVLIALLSLVVVNIGPFGNACAQGKKQGASPPQPTKKNVAFEDKFERDDLGEMYDILDPDPNRLTLNDGKLLIVATEPRKNHILLRQTSCSDFVAIVAVTMQVTEHNWVGLYYWVDEQTYLALGLRGEDLLAYILDDKGRQPTFIKALDGQQNQIRPKWSQLGNRELIDFLQRPEISYFQLQRQGSTYTGRMSVAGVK
jgi:hypothetical protein